MVPRGRLVLLLLSLVSSLGASYRTPNFVVEAPTPEVARGVGEAAERYRKERAQYWLSAELPRWAKPCPLRVTLNAGNGNGATSFAFDKGRVLDQSMQVGGSRDKILTGCLPHEVTHTILAQHFGQPVPRWADEGAAILAETAQEQARHDRLLEQILEQPGRFCPLRRLLALRDYPPDVLVLYAEGQSLTRFLVAARGPATFLVFVNQGMRDGWDEAVRANYPYQDVTGLERAWVTDVRIRRSADLDFWRSFSWPRCSPLW